MNSSDLLRIQVAGGLHCRALNNLIGPTGPTGSIGPPNPTGLKSFTLFLDYSGLNAITKVYVPPGLFANAPLAAGGVFTANVGTDLTFLGTNSIQLANTTNAFLSGFTLSGYVAAGYWQPISAARLIPTATHYTVTTDYAANLLGLGLGNINGGTIVPKAPSGIAAGYVATITLLYI